jgi:hypothetical protein
VSSDRKLAMGPIDVSPGPTALDFAAARVACTISSTAVPPAAVGAGFGNGAFIVMKSERQRRRHGDIGSAQTEAQRLADASGTTFIVAREVASAKPGQRKGTG